MSSDEPDLDHEYEPLPPRPQPERRRGGLRRLGERARWVLLGIAVVFVAALAGILSLTQTDWGRGQVLKFTLEAIGGRLNGELAVGRLEGGLLTGARLYEVSLRDTSGAPLLVADSVFIRYRLATFTGGDIVINRLDLFDGEVDIFRMPGDSLWNYQEILKDPHPEPSPGPPGATLIERFRLYNARISLRSPVEPDPALSQADQESELARILSDTARFVIEEVPGGYLQTTTIDAREVGIQELFIGPDERGGTYLEITDAFADIRLWKDPPLEVRDLRASLHLREGILNYQAPEVVLADSRGSSTGSVDLRDGQILYNLVIHSPDFALADLRWLYPWLPEDPSAGRGSGRLRVEDREDGLAVIARDLVLRMPDTHITGTFGLLITPESLHFVDVDLEAEPLRVESVEQLLPTDIPVQGLVIGGATIRGEG